MLVSIDYSQQELRWLAILTGDPALLEVYQKGLDMHSRITCQIHGINYDMFEEIRNHKGDTEEETQINIKNVIANWKGTDETGYAIGYINDVEGSKLESLDEGTVVSLANSFELMRKKTKSVVFGTVYGITEIGLADQLGGTKEEAKQLIDGFKAGLPKYLEWESNVHNKIMKQGYAETVLGRKRRFGETIAEAKQTDLYKRKKWHWKIEGCKRQSSNSEVQGSSADQSKRAMVELHYPTRPDGTLCFDRDEWINEGYQSIADKHDVHILLQVHDEIVFDAPMDTPWEVLEQLADIMQNVIPNDMGIEFKSDIEASPYWGGVFSREEIQQVVDGKLDWKARFQDEVQQKIKKQLGDDYEVGDFMEKDEEDVA